MRPRNRRESKRKLDRRTRCIGQGTWRDIVTGPEAPTGNMGEVKMTVHVFVNVRVINLCYSGWDRLFLRQRLSLMDRTWNVDSLEII